MTSIAEKMVPGGSCLARVDGKAVFVPGALPGEAVELRVVKDKKDYAVADIIRVIEPSSHRVEPACPLFGRCGGCDLQMASAAYQRELRVGILREALARARVGDVPAVSCEGGDDWGYRSRFQFHRDATGAPGLKEANGAAVVPISDCPVARREIRDALGGDIRRAAASCPPGGRFHVFGYGDRLWHEYGDRDCAVAIAGRTIKFDVRGFFQSNVPLLERAVRLVGAGLSGARLLDFYAGVGTLSAFASEGFESVTLVEHNGSALDLARGNLPARVAGTASFCAVSDEAWPTRREAGLRYDAAIVDPPRQGIARKALEWFLSSGIPSIRYLSCDPVTFARDAVLLVSGGYRLSSLTLLDFYPQTHHVETLGVFER